MRIAVIIASLRRPNELMQVLERIALQTIQPCATILSVEVPTDLPNNIASHIQVVMGPRGSSAQRNRGMSLAIEHCDVLVFFDDDYIPSKRALEGIATLFQENPDVVGATGCVLADGIAVGGIDYEEAIATVNAFDNMPTTKAHIERDIRGVYGCNMAFRTSAVCDTKFDEDLPLYGWQEDVDFAARLIPKGRIVKTTAFAGVHRGVTSGRNSGVSLGFSQVVNPVYLFKKGTMNTREVAGLIMRNLISNHIRMIWPESWIDRKGRVKGNWLGIINVLVGQADPRKVLDISK